jgi:voltage-gated potassium channel
MYRRVQRQTRRLLELDGGGRDSQLVDVCIMSLILLSVGAVIAGSVDAVRAEHGQLLSWIERISVTVFTLEYVARLWAAGDRETVRRPVVDRLGVATQPYMLVDLVAILPFFLGAVLDLRFLRALRLFRFLRVLKLARYSTALRRFGRVVREKREEFTLTAVAAVIVLIVVSSAMYYAERGAQPEAFGSIPQAMWWGVVTLTTVGYGGVTPVTPLGRALNAAVAVLGIGLFSLPASVLASGFIESDDDEESATTPDCCPHCGRALDDHSE